MLDLIFNTLIQGLIYSLLAYGILITYKILDFPDLSVDGTFPLGAAVSALVSFRVTVMAEAPEKSFTPPEEEYPTPEKPTV